MKVKKIKICQICSIDFTFKYFLTELIYSQKKIGWSVTCVSNSGSFLKSLKSKNFNIKEIEISRSFNLLKHIFSIVKLIVYFRKAKFDIIHVHTPIAALLVRIAKFFFSNTKIVYTAHGFYFHENMNKIYFYLHVILEKILCKNVDILFVQSKEDYNFAKKYNFVKSKKLFEIGNGIDLERFDNKKVSNFKTNLIKKKYSINSKDFVIGIVARLVKEKGIIDFIEIVKKLYFKNIKIIALIVGDYNKNEHSENVKQEINDAKKILGKKLIVTGFKDDVENYLSVMDVFCLPSYREGLPRSIIEAMAMEKPVVAYNIRGCRELIRNGRTGYLVNYKDLGSFEKKIIFLINNFKIKKSMGKSAKRIVKMKNNEKNIVNYQNSIIKNICH